MLARIWFTFFLCNILANLPSLAAAEPESAKSGEHSLSGFRGPVDVTLSQDGRYLISVNQLSDTVSLIDLSNGQVIAEQKVGDHPSSIAQVGKDRVLISCARSGTIVDLQFNAQGLRQLNQYSVGFEPVGLAVDSRNMRAYVGQASGSSIAAIDLAAGSVMQRIEVGSWPRYLTLSPDGSRLAVGCSGDGKVYVVDTAKQEVLYDEPFSGGINLGHMQASRDGKYAYVPWMIYRTNPIDVRNIQLGWVLASRIARVRLDGAADREAIALDVPRIAVADPHGLAITDNEHRLAVTASGTHELLVYRLKDLPFEGAGGPGDLIDRRLLADRDLFYRIELGGRPMGLVIAADNRTAYIANYLQDAIQVVDIESKQVGEPISLGAMPARTVAHRGMEIFYDGRRSLDQWYSCHTCHYNGGINSKAMDTENDGSFHTFKTVLPLEKLHETSPWTWHGWQTDKKDAMKRSFTKTMQGPPINDEDVKSILTYLETLDIPASPYRQSDGSLSAAARRGEEIFRSDKAGCATCHSGSLYTDGQIHDVGLGGEKDRYKGYNTPMLTGLYRKVRFLHDGRTKSLDEVLTNYHAPEKVSGQGKLTEQELGDLIEYLKSL